MIEITRRIRIPEQQLTFKFSRSTGPGGQNVNKVNTKVTLLFNLAASDSFSKIQKKRISGKLAARISKDGLLRITCQKYRTQKANRATAIERLRQLLKTALHTPKIRKKTAVPQAAKQKRLEDKRRRSSLKKQRAKKNLLDDF